MCAPTVIAARIRAEGDYEGGREKELADERRLELRMQTPHSAHRRSACCSTLTDRTMTCLRLAVLACTVAAAHAAVEKDLITKLPGYKTAAGAGMNLQPNVEPCACTLSVACC